MNARRTPWWLWLVGAVVLLGVLEVDVPIVPLVIGALILSRVVGAGGSSRSSRPRPGPLEGGPSRRTDRPPPRDPVDRWEPPERAPMPTIDVPRYPGEGTGGPRSSSSSPPPPLPPTGPPPVAPPGGVPHSPTDPVVSLGQLHLSRCGRDLQAAMQHGTGTDVARVLGEVGDLSTRLQGLLGGASGTPGSGRREFAAGLRAVDRLLADARGEHPPGGRVTRLARACLRMGETGRHE